MTDTTMTTIEENQGSEEMTGERLWEPVDENDQFRPYFTCERKQYTLDVYQYFQGGYQGSLSYNGEEVFFTEVNEFFHAVRSRLANEYQRLTRELKAGFVGDYPPHFLPFLGANREIYHPGLDGENVDKIRASLQVNGGVILQRILIGQCEEFFDGGSTYTIAVVSGARRTQAAVLEGIELVPIEVKAFNSYAEIIDVLIDANDTVRERSREIIMREIAKRHRELSAITDHRKSRTHSEQGRAWEIACKGFQLGGRTAEDLSDLLDWIDGLPGSHQKTMRALFNSGNRVASPLKKIKNNLYGNPNYGPAIALQVAEMLIDGTAKSVEKALNLIIQEKQQAEKEKAEKAKAKATTQRPDQKALKAASTSNSTTETVAQAATPVLPATAVETTSNTEVTTLLYPQQKMLTVQEHSPAMSDQWYTPQWLVSIIEEVLGGIDIDPCADPGKQVPAKWHFTGMSDAEDGLLQDWQVPSEKRRVTFFANIPYSNPLPWFEWAKTQYEKGNIDKGIFLCKQGVKSNKGTGLIQKNLFSVSADMIGRTAFICPPEHKKWRENQGKSNKNLDNPDFDITLLFLGDEIEPFCKKFVEMADVRIAYWYKGFDQETVAVDDFKSEEEINWANVWTTKGQGAIAEFSEHGGHKIEIKKTKNGFKVSDNGNVELEGCESLESAKSYVEGLFV